MNKFTEGLERVGNKYRLVENILVDKNHCRIEQIPMTEKILVEGKEFKADRKIIVPIWSIDPNNRNYNGRNYSRVIEKVMRLNLVTYCLCEHPEDEGNFHNVIAIAKNPRINEETKWLEVEVIPLISKEDGRKIYEILDNGGAIYVSSSALGDIDSNGYVLEEGFTLERWCDILSGSPSNGIATYSNRMEFMGEENNTELISQTENIEEIKEKTSLVKEHKDNASEEKIYKTGENRMSDKLVETNLQFNIRSMIKDADKIENLYEKKELLTNAYSYAKELTDKTLSEEIAKKQEELESQLKELTEKGLKTDELNESVKGLTEEKTSLTEKVDALKKENEEVKAKLDTITKMYENKQYLASESEMRKSHNLSKEVCSLKLKAKRLESKLVESVKENKVIKSKLEKTLAESNGKADADTVQKLIEQVANLKAVNESLKKRMNTLRLAELEEKRERAEVSKRNARFETIRKSLREPVRATKVVEHRIPQTPKKEGLTEDAKMEMMLSGKTSLTESQTKNFSEGSEDEKMEKMLGL